MGQTDHRAEVREFLSSRRARITPEQAGLHAMLESMAGVTGERDALTYYTRPLTGAYYFVPALDDLAASGTR